MPPACVHGLCSLTTAGGHEDGCTAESDEEQKIQESESEFESIYELARARECDNVNHVTTKQRHQTQSTQRTFLGPFLSLPRPLHPHISVGSFVACFAPRHACLCTSKHRSRGQAGASGGWRGARGGGEGKIRLVRCWSRASRPSTHVQEIDAVRVRI